MQLRLTDGTTTVDFVGATTGIAGVTYFPAAGDGLETVTETAEVVASGTAAQVRTATTSIERLLDGARRRRAQGVGPRVFLEYKPVTSDSLYRSEVYDGRVAWPEDPGARRLNDTTPRVKYALMVTRAAWWEGPETELELASNGFAAGTGGKQITTDGIKNWVSIASDQVTGTLPAPVRLRMTNTVGSAQYFRDYYIGLNAFSTPATFGHLLQGESAVSGYGTTQNNANCSGGQFQRLSVGTTGAYAIAWLLPAAMMAGNGRWFRLILRAGAVTMPTGITVRPEIWDKDGLNQLWKGGEQTLSGVDLHDLGSVPIPPGAWDASWGQVRLLLWMKSAVTTQTVEIDYISVLGTDAYRQMVQVGMQVANNDSVEFDDIEGKHYMLATATKYPYFVARGAPLVVYPGQQQRFCFAEMLTTGSAPITHTFTVQVWARMRRSTV